jgi:hypothetical protein
VELVVKMRFKVLAAMNIKMAFSWGVALCSLVELTDVSEVLVASIIRGIRQTTRRNIPEDSHLGS